MRIQQLLPPAGSMHRPARITEVGTRVRRYGRLLAAVFLLLLADSAHAQEGIEPDENFNKGGRTSFQFLKIGLGARQTAMGEAAIAVVQDVNSVFWNPANITGISNAEAAFSYVRWLADMKYVAGAVGYSMRGVGTVAVSVAALNYGEIPEALTSGGSGDARTGQTFSGGDFLLGVTYARPFTDRLSIGIGVKYLRESLWNYSAGTVAVDIGSLYDIGYKGLKLAMSAQNFGGTARWLDRESSDTEEGYDLPLVFRLGVATSLLGPGENAIVDGGHLHRAVMSAEVINTNDYSGRVHLGFEYTLQDLLALRAGYRFNYAEGNFSLGAGLTPPLGGIDMRVDYAYVQYEYLNAPHRLTLSLGF